MSMPRPRLSVAMAFRFVTIRGDHAMSLMDEYDEHLMRPIALAMNGDISLRQSQNDPEVSEGWYKLAIAHAREQNARMWDLRAATRLARLWHSQGKTTEARDLLAPVYGWFTEGFDSADLREAKALVDELI